MASIKEKKDDYIDRLVEVLSKQIEKSNAPWQKEWTGTENTMPVNAKEQKYRGTNMLNLYVMQDEKGYTDNRYYTFNEIKKNGWKLTKGAKAEQIFFYSAIEKETKKKLIHIALTMKIELMKRVKKRESLCLGYIAFLMLL